MPVDATFGIVCALQRGAVRPLGPKGVPSTLVRSPVSCPVLVGARGLTGDAQGEAPEPGATFVLINDHAPIPLLRRIEQTWTDDFDVAFLQDGPDVW